jgi:proteasome accessory factor B
VSDNKTERLINLTLALLATKRYLTKSEILENVAGYKGTQEAKERMFERDKDDLRSLGIEIEVGDLDVFFEDEPGYRIPQKSYELVVPELTGRELALISIASNFWNDSVLAPSAQSGIRKLQSLGIPAVLDFDFRMKYRFENPSANLEVLTAAINQRSRVTFSYDSTTLQIRHLEPYRVLIWNGFWYLIGMDLDRNEIRIFKLSRFVSGIEISKRKDEFEIPNNFDATAYLPKSDVSIMHRAKINIRKDSALILRNRGVFLAQDGEYETFELTYENELSFLRELIWYEDNIKIIEPISLRDALLALIVGVAQ